MLAGDLTGKKFGRLTVAWPEGRSNRGIIWLCFCECGNPSHPSTFSLVKGNSKSCGCLRAAVLNKKRHLQIGPKSPRYKHGLTGTPEHAAWANMLSRCSNPKATFYGHYGGRGIKVCERWKGPSGFQNFLSDMGPKTDRSLTIERRNNDGNYEPENCYWATRSQQIRNRRALPSRTRDSLGRFQ